MTDAKADARMLGPERIAALLVALAGAGESNGLKFAVKVERDDLEAAARRLAAPEAIGCMRLWAWRSGGPNPQLYFSEAPTSPTDTPGMFIPGKWEFEPVALDRMTALVIRQMAADYREEVFSSPRQVSALAALERALADTEGK